MLDHPRRWNINVLHMVFNVEIVKAISRIPLYEHEEDDRIKWMEAESGQCWVKTG